MHRDYGEPVAPISVFSTNNDPETEKELDSAIIKDFGSCSSLEYFNPEREELRF
jgi:hypothetical protein